MQRDLDELAARTFDVLVVGGGICGLTIAYDAAQRGLSVALVERDDFGSGTSFNHLRTIHGGLRYLQTFDLRRARESVRERRAIATIAPHAVAPLPFALPLERSMARGRLAMRAGFALDRLVGFDRNRGVIPSHRLPAGRVVSKHAAAARFPGLRRRGVIGAAVWYDYVTTEPDRLTFSFAWAAAQHGAVLANHLEAAALLRDRTGVVGAHVRDLVDGRDLDVRARVTVNATGGAADRLLEPIGIPTRMPLLKAMNLVTRREAGAAALCGRAASGRHLFLVPWRGRALFGTWESAAACRPEDGAPVESEIGGFIAEINEAFPALELARDEVTLVHRGIVPAAVAGGGRMALEGHDQIWDHATAGVEGLLTVAGAKYTTARGAAERATDRLLEKLAHGPVACRTATAPLPGGGIRDYALAIADARRSHGLELPSDTIPHLVSAYGSRYSDVLRLCADRPDWRTRLATHSPVIGAQLVWAVRHEMAVTLADAAIRRTPLGSLGYPGGEAAARAADLVGGLLGWSPDRREAELAEFRRFYAGARRPV